MTLFWDAKDPDDILDYAVNWSDFLNSAGDADTIATFSLEVISGTVTLSDASLAEGATHVRGFVHGGADGETAVLLNRINTVGGRQKDETIVLPVISTTVTAGSGYTAPTAAQLLARFPRFAAVDPSVVANALVEAQSMVDETWTEADFAMGRMLWAAHVLTLDGLGTGAEAQAAAAGTGGFKVMRSGALTLERFGDGKAVTGSAATSYGQRWHEMARRNRGGPLVTSGVVPASAAAFDYPWY